MNTTARLIFLTLTLAVTAVMRAPAGAMERLSQERMRTVRGGQVQEEKECLVTMGGCQAYAGDAEPCTPYCEDGEARSYQIIVSPATPKCVPNVAYDCEVIAPNPPDAGWPCVRQFRYPNVACVSPWDEAYYGGYINDCRNL